VDCFVERLFVSRSCTQSDDRCGDWTLVRVPTTPLHDIKSSLYVLANAHNADCTAGGRSREDDWTDEDVVVTVSRRLSDTPPCQTHRKRLLHADLKSINQQIAIILFARAVRSQDISMNLHGMITGVLFYKSVEDLNNSSFSCVKHFTRQVTSIEACSLHIDMIDSSVVRHLIAVIDVLISSDCIMS